MDDEAHKAECLARFHKAIRMGRNQDYTGAQTIVAHIRKTSGDAAAETARLELFKYIKSDKPVNEPSQTVDQSTREAANVEQIRSVKRGGRTVRT